MEPGPSKIIERIIGWLIPPAVREEVLGDLRERYETPVRYFFEAVYTIPCVIYSRIRRTTDPVLLLMEAMASYVTYVLAAWWLDRSLLFDATGYARLAALPAIRIVAGMLGDAYSKPQAPSPLSWFVIWWWLYVLWFGFSTPQGRFLPSRVVAVGAVTTDLLLFTIRAVFRPVADKPQRVSGPVYWQKLELSPAVASVRRVLLIGAVLFAALLYVAFRYGNWR